MHTGHSLISSLPFLFSPHHLTLLPQCIENAWKDSGSARYFYIFHQATMATAHNIASHKS